MKNSSQKCNQTVPECETYEAAFNLQQEFTDSESKS